MGDVVKKGKAAGITLSPNYVSNIRSSAKAAAKKGPAKPGAPKKTAAPKSSGAAKVVAAGTEKPAAPPATAAPALTVTEFIKGQPRDIPAADVVKAAKKAGLTIDANYVYKVRARLGAKPAPKAPVAARQSAARPPATTTAKPAPAPKPTKPAPAPKAPKTPPVPAARPALTAAPKGTAVAGEVAFRKLVVELGVARAEALIVEVKRKLAELFAGA